MIFYHGFHIYTSLNLFFNNYRHLNHPTRPLPRENKRRKVSVVGQKTVTIINTGAAFMGARDWDEETSINL